MGRVIGECETMNSKRPLRDTRGSGLIWLIAAYMMVQPLATDLYLPSLPHIAAYFRASPALVQQTLSIFVLGFAGLQLVSGPLSDHLGRRPVLLMGMVIYILASIACAFAPTLDALIFGRFVQAIGCCTVVVVARTIVHDVYPDAEGAHVMARVSSFYALAPLLGPLAGAYLQVTFGWRAAFVVYSLTGIALVALTLIYLKETHIRKNAQAFAVGRIAVNYFRLIRNPVFWSYTLHGALSFGSIFIFLSGSSFLLINVFKVPTMYTGIFFACGATGYLVGTIVCRRQLRRHGIDRTLSTGSYIAFIACLIYPSFAVAGMANWSTLLIGNCLVMFAHGINFPCAQSGAVTPFPGNTGAAAALMGSFSMVLAFGLGTLVGVTYNGTPFPIAFILAVTGGALLLCNHLMGRFRKPE
jgi:DHA1 family bicyclomycin/chloramphenicol resistance-like MFS transporter